jgi:hypothetical protein
MLKLPSLITAFAFSLGACQSQAAPQNLQVVYTQLKSCSELEANPNAAHSELKCPAIGKYEVRVEQAGQEYFGISLIKNGKKITSDFDAFTAMRPAGQAIEWHLQSEEPVFMVFRIRSEEAGAEKETLTLSLVTEAGICPLASIATHKNPKANQQVRDLISGQFAQTRSCPASIVKI